MDKFLHIICLDIPAPPDYGGAIDMYYKLKALHQQGVRITLHCFQYGKRKPDAILESFAEQVHYYPRLTGWRGLDTTLPYIVSSRRSEDLLKHLLRDDHPILFEGVHTTFFAGHPSLSHRLKLLRTHNVEADYYRQLVSQTSDYLKRSYFTWEAMRLKPYEESLPKFDHFLHISGGEEAYFSKHYPASRHHVLPAFHAAESMECLLGKGSYCLYHGNLSVAENEKAVHFLVSEIMPGLDIPLIIAGKNPGADILKLSRPGIRVIPNPEEEYLNRLIMEAQVNVLPFFQHTGVKLKLLHALFRGRHCLVNDLSATDTALRECVHLEPDPAQFRQRLIQLMQQEFTPGEMQRRESRLLSFDNSHNAAVLASLL